MALISQSKVSFYYVSIDNDEPKPILIVDKQWEINVKNHLS